MPGMSACEIPDDLPPRLRLLRNGNIFLTAQPPLLRKEGTTTTEAADPCQQRCIGWDVEVEVRRAVNENGCQRAGASQCKPAAIGIPMKQPRADGMETDQGQKPRGDQEPRRAELRQILQVIVVGVILDEIERGCLEPLKRRLVASKSTTKERIGSDEVQRVVPDIQPVFAGKV